jgi:hypothetical protein
MRLLHATAEIAAVALSVPASAQMPGSAPATLPGTTTRDNAAAAGAAVAGGPAMNRNTPAQNAKSAHDNTTGNNSTSSGNGAAGTPMPSGSMTTGGAGRQFKYAWFDKRRPRRQEKGIGL